VRDRASPNAPERNVTFQVTQGRVTCATSSRPTTAETLFSMREPAHRGRAAGGPANLEHLGVRHRVAHIAPRHRLRHRGRGRPRLRAALPARWTHRVRLDAPAAVARGVARRGQPQFAALDEDRAEPAFVLHVMNADGSASADFFNQSHDLDPSVLGDGRVMFSRWDNSGGLNAVHLYTVNPDAPRSNCSTARTATTLAPTAARSSSSIPVP